MTFFDEASLRLKQQLKVTTDKEASEVLGLSQRAWAGRKDRDSFPVKEVFMLAAQRPELGLDPDWIVTGSSNKMETAGSREASLLQCFRKLTDGDQQRLLQSALLWSGEMVLSIPQRKSSEDEIDLLGPILRGEEG
ncbi:hypothetical protein GCM10007933_21280 [Zoogloea oryzae]|uniref:Bacteriophage CI repressor n=1 Tax=Zoogloea oryzae TaxID=310767 RepID=A0ABQ6FAT8_9RHOO|nr:hypothetical protein [Zoogloea oryzae]GLT22668.1 hypothetical protein GCM10007933_21280 [Zoogloea oryzae]